MKSSYKRIHKLADSKRWLINNNNIKLVVCTKIDDESLHGLFGIVDLIDNKYITY